MALSIPLLNLKDKKLANLKVLVSGECINLPGSWEWGDSVAVDFDV